MTETPSRILEILEKHEAEILADWLQEQVAAPTARPDLMNEEELREQSASFIRLLRHGVIDDAADDIQAPEWAGLREMLDEVTRSRVKQGFTPSETATFVLSFKHALFTRLQRSHDRVADLGDDIWRATVLLDKLALYTTELFQKTREEVIARQQQEMIELSTPVVEVWEGVLALPLIGTLDSRRTQTVMEALLQGLLDTQAEIAIIDITGVPAVDTMTAQHLHKTVKATRLMGAECIISGVRPKTAQAMIEMGVDFGDVLTRATMADALQLAYKRRGLVVRPRSEAM